MPLDNTLQPAIVLVLWTLVMWVWMYATRIPAIQAAKINPQSAKHPGSLSALPSSVRQVADNYNHLHEQPTLFYAACIIAHLAQPTDAATGDAIALYAAWAYVGLRVAHSLVQATINVVALRFSLFALSTIALAVLAARAAMAVLA